MTKGLNHDLFSFYDCIQVTHHNICLFQKNKLNNGKSGSSGSAVSQSGQEGLQIVGVGGVGGLDITSG